MERVIIDIFAQLDAPEGSAFCFCFNRRKKRIFLSVAFDVVTLFFYFDFRLDRGCAD
jgi:hypothetical protein